MSKTLQFWVDGIPAPGGSKTAFVPMRKGTKEPFRRPNGSIIVNVTDAAGEKNKEWRKAVALAASQKMRGNEPVSVAIRAHFIFYMPRPKAHFRSNGQLRGDAPLHHTNKPDALKLARSTEDALTGVAYVDDALIVSGTQEKIYTVDRPGALITLHIADDSQMKLTPIQLKPQPEPTH